MTARGLTTFYFYVLIVYLIGIIGVTLFLFLTDRRQELKKLRYWLIVSTGLISLLILLTLSSISFFATSSNCIICHEMKPEFNSWKQSRHRNVDCIGCHLNSEGAIGFAIEDLESFRELKNHITGNYEKIINKDSRVSQKIMTSKNCIRCHPGNQPTLIFGIKVRINHQEHTRAGISCPTCHNRISHRGARSYNYLDGVRMMDGCMRCHSPGEGKAVGGEKAPTGCSVCHLDKNIGQEVFGKKEINKFDFINCEACHKLRDPRIVSQFKQSQMFKEEGLNCESCHKGHDSKKFNPKPDPIVCNKCHKEFSKKVVQKKHGEEVKNPFKKVSEVKCSFCHPSHSFSIPKSK